MNYVSFILWEMVSIDKINLWGLENSCIFAVEKKKVLWEKDCLKERFTTSC